MDRLTARTPDKGLVYLAKVKPDEQEVESKYPKTLQCIMDSWERLAAYEDTGLMPDEIIASKLEEAEEERESSIELFIEARRTIQEYCGGDTGLTERITEWLDATYRRKEGD